MGIDDQRAQAMSQYNISWLKKKQESGERQKFLYFWSNKNRGLKDIGSFVLSQWFESDFTDGNIVYRTAEHWMMAEKARLFNDALTLDKILSANSPGEAKALGRNVSNFNEEIWMQRRSEIVKQGSFLKFSQDERLKTYLCASNPRILVEASPIDTIWGAGLSADDDRISNVNEWPGLNLLGFALMEVRDMLIGLGL